MNVIAKLSYIVPALERANEKRKYLKITHIKDVKGGDAYDWIICRTTTYIVTIQTKKH